ncbi:Hypothetical predicted protein, partial [Mytilus galloprovincialis]
MRKYPQTKFSIFGTGLKIGLVVEVGILATSFIWFKRLNNSQGLRYEYSQKHPKFLEYYYKVDDMIGNSQIRKSDHEAWKKE